MRRPGPRPEAVGGPGSACGVGIGGWMRVRLIPWFWFVTTLVTCFVAGESRRDARFARSPPRLG